jgi:hypothetical protein
MGHMKRWDTKFLCLLLTFLCVNIISAFLQQIWTPEITLVFHALPITIILQNAFLHTQITTLLILVDTYTLKGTYHIIFNMITVLCLDPICGLFQCSLTTTHFWSWLFKTKWRLCVTCNTRDLNFATHQVSLCMSRQHMGNGETVALIFNLSSIRRSVVTFMLQLLYHQGEGPGTDYVGEWVGPISRLDILAKRNVSCHCCRCIYVFYILILIINSNYCPIQN